MISATFSLMNSFLHSAATPPPFICRAAALFLLCAFAPEARAQCAEQKLVLARGWNAIYLEVSPEATADEVFAAWPVDSVGVYDPASFLATRQFSATADTFGLGAPPIAMWRRDVPDASPVERIPAGTVCMAFNTGGVFRTTLRGVPAAPRTTWHVTDEDTVYNLFGFSVQGTQSVTPDAYLDGFSGLDGRGRTCWMIGGTARDEPYRLIRATTATAVEDGAVMLLPSSEISDWSGALFVSPMSGLDFGEDGTRATLSIRNDGGAPRTVALNLDRAVEELDTRVPFSASFLRWRDEDVALTNTAWNEVAAMGEVARKSLAEGETWRIAFGLDRAALPGSLPRGVPFGALLTALDLDGGTKMKAVVPLRGETSGSAAALTAWPAGLWVAEAALDTVIAPGSSTGTPTGGRAKIRLPLHVDGHGVIRLLQRVVAAGDTSSDGTLSYRLYAGSAAVPGTATEALRISSVVLPTETPVIEADEGGSLREGASFRFTVAADGATSLLRHPLHPQHDGLRWDFSTPAPSGDDIANYKGDVKPETFSVSCRIDLTLDMDGGEAAWNPEGSKTGTCRWTFSNLMRQGDVVLSGPMAVKRVSPIAELELE